jgi:hypothetical protein
MQARSAQWDSRIAAPHRVRVSVAALLAGEPVPSASDLRVTAGKVTLDRRAAVRGRLQIDLAEPLLIPNGPGDPLSPFGFELAVSRGIVYPDGAEELKPLGVFPIQSSLADDVAVTKIDALDRAQLVRDARLEDDYPIAAGTNYATAIEALLAAGVPQLTFSFVSTAFTTPALVVAAQADRWDQAVAMARSIGCQLYFDGEGVCVLAPEVSITAQPVLSVAEGPGGVLLDTRIKLDRATSFNRVIATSVATSSTAAFRGVATDTDAASPTQYGGPFGRKPRFFSSPLLTSSAQCQAAAEGILASDRGVGKSITFDVVPNPALEPGDVVQIRRAALGLDEAHILDRLDVPLNVAGVMTAETRQVSA